MRPAEHIAWQGWGEEEDGEEGLEGTKTDDLPFSLRVDSVSLADPPGSAGFLSTVFLEVQVP